MKLCRIECFRWGGTCPFLRRPILKRVYGLDSLNTGGETVSTPCNASDVMRTIIAATQHPTQMRNLHTYIRGFNHHPRPCDRHQVPMGKHLAM
ncbi:hypothetical protein D3C84_322460 [compost metagenome]